MRSDTTRLKGLREHLYEYVNKTLTVNEIKKIGVLHNTNYATTKMIAKTFNITIK